MIAVVATVQDCDIIVSEFELQSRYYVYFQTNSIRKVMNSLIFPAIGKIISMLFFHKESFGIK